VPEHSAQKGSTDVKNDFRSLLRDEFEKLVSTSRNAWPRMESLRMDLHCHDGNSDVPDERIGRLLRLPETWLPSARLAETLTKWGMDVVTITNHNNARSCWELQDKGHDILAGAEFDCSFDELGVVVHVLTYGFTPAQEVELQRRRRTIGDFLEYTADQDLPTVLAHPLHVRSSGSHPPLALYDRLALMFERFEVINGQRDSWQNMLAAAWVQSLTREKLEMLSQRCGIPADRYCRNPWIKRMCGGSDDHFGFFAGMAGTMLRVPGLIQRLQTRSKSELALEAIRVGETAPFGSCNEDEKLSLALLDYFCQAVLNMKDPGLIRMMLHVGSIREKLLALLVANAMFELRRHRYTVRFLSEFNGALNGRRPGFLTGAMVRGSLRTLMNHVEQIAEIRKGRPERTLEIARDIIPQLFRDLNLLFIQRAADNLSAVPWTPGGEGPIGRELLERLEIPVQLRSFFSPERELRGEDMTRINLGELLDGLPFPFLMSAVIAGAAFASARVLYRSRPLLNRFAKRIGRFEHPRRALWLTDTLFDRNGVSQALQALLLEIQRRDLPIDLLALSSTPVPPQPHLVTLEPLGEFPAPFYKGQPFRIPNLLEMHRVFVRGGYDRVVCSTELLMGPLALYLKQAFSVPAYFFVHSDWMDFADKTLGLDHASRDRLRRLLRAFYRAFDGLLVLNTDHRSWLESPEIGIPPERIHLTAHWIDERFRRQPGFKSAVFPGVDDQDPVLLFVGRLSEEKGVMLLPGIHEAIRARLPRTRLVVAGTGPAADRLRASAPDAIFLGWVDSARLPEIYSQADVMVFPSRFDTFGCAVLEAMQCGLPVAAFDTKGPKDIIEDGINGFLMRDEEDFARRLVAYLDDPALSFAMRRAAQHRARDFRPQPILDRLMGFVGLDGTTGPSGDRPSTPECGDDERIDLAVEPTFLADLLGVVADQ